MARIARLGRLVAVVVALLLLPVASGCGGGGGFSGPAGFLEVQAHAAFFGDYIYEIDVYDGFGLVTSDSVAVFDGEIVSLGAYAVGFYDVDVFWTDGFTFPVSADFFTGVEIDYALTTQIDSFE
jgi:hypothetical protein